MKTESTIERIIDNLNDSIDSCLNDPSTASKLSGIIVPRWLYTEGALYPLEDFTRKDGGLQSDPHAGWYRNIPVYLSDLATHTVIF